jgi:hypothetical protein
MFVAPSTIAQASWTSATPRSRQPDPLPFASAALSAGINPVRSATLRNSTMPAWPIRLSSSARTSSR